jgi:multidrug efflux system outer membrane protein
MSKRLLPLLVMLAAGCSMIPEYQRPTAPVPDTWPSLQVASGARGVGSGGRPPATGANAFPDPRLQALIAAALEHNRDLRIALARVDEARAQAGIARADRFPQVDVLAQRAASLTPADLSATNRQLNASATM